jgi:hypothetical protein
MRGTTVRGMVHWNVHRNLHLNFVTGFCHVEDTRPRTSSRLITQAPRSVEKIFPPDHNITSRPRWPVLPERQGSLTRHKGGSTPSSGGTTALHAVTICPIASPARTHRPSAARLGTAHIRRRRYSCRVRPDAGRSHSLVKASHSPPPGRCLPGIRPAAANESIVPRGLSPRTRAPITTRLLTARVEKMTTQGEEEMLTVQRHRTGPASLIRAQAGEHLCCEEFDRVQVQLFESLTGSENSQDADGLRRQGGVAYDVLRPMRQPIDSRSRISPALWGN